MIVVTGGAGYIGSHTVLALKERGHKVAIVDNFSRGHRDLVFGDHLVEADIRDTEHLTRELEKLAPEAVVHFAASSLVGESMTAPETYYDNNVAGSISLLTAARAAGIKGFVLSSTAAVYGEPQTIPIPEDTELTPTNVYGETKLFIESMLARYHAAYGLDSIALRYFNAAGADSRGRTGEDHTPETHLIPLVLDVALGKRENIKIFGTDYPTADGTCVRDYIHVTDLASAHVLAVERLLGGKGSCEAFNLGTGNGFSVREIIETTRKVTGHAIPAEETDRRPGDPAVLIAGSKKAEEILGWKRAHDDIETVIETAWTWHRKRC